MVAAPQHHEGLPDGHEAQQDTAQQDKLEAAHTGEQGVQRAHGGIFRHQTVDAGRHHVGDGVAEGQIERVELCGDAVHGDRGRALKPCEQLPVDGPVEVVHHDADKDIQREAEHLPQQTEVVAAEGEGHPQLRQAVADIQDAAEDGKDQGDDGQRHGAVADDKQGDHDQGVEHLLAHGHDLLEQIPLVDGDVGLKDADGEGQGGVDRHDPQQLFRQRDLLRRQLFAEDHIAVGQAEADDQHRRAQHQIGDEEHTVELGAALFIAGGAEAGIVPDIGAAQSEAQQIQIGDDGQDGLIDAELTVAQTLQHDGRVHQRDNGAQRHGHIGQHGARPYLIHLQRSTFFFAE